jgi:hypothetical protein
VGRDRHLSRGQGGDGIRAGNHTAPGGDAEPGAVGVGERGTDIGGGCPERQGCDGPLASGPGRARVGSGRRVA